MVDGGSSSDLSFGPKQRGGGGLTSLLARSGEEEVWPQAGEDLLKPSGDIVYVIMCSEK